MTTYHPPTILTSRGIPGIVPSSASGNLAWNEDGQCMFISRRVVHILTPYLTSTLQPPANLVDPNLVLEYPISTVNKAKKRMEEDMDVDETGTPGPSTRESSGSRVMRMKTGEVKWWTTGIEVDKEGVRERLYNWIDAGDEYSAVITDKEATVRAAVWSPSGMSDLGGSLLAVLTSFGQISIYAPRMDPASKQWEEISDLTMKTKILYDSEEQGPRTPMNATRLMLRLKSSCMQWSPAIDGDEFMGCCASILAVASRAGSVSLWSYGPDRHFKRETVVEVCSSFLTTMSWSKWSKDTDGYRSKLAMATSDGLVTLLDVLRTPVLGQSGDVSWILEVHKAAIAGQSDRRNITSLYWHDSGGLLVWTKSGSVSLCRDQAISSNWIGIRELRLRKVGNWAGANSINNCVGIQPFGKDRLLVTLAGLTQHLITDIWTEPKLAPLTESLRLSVAVRDCFLEFVNDEGMNRDRHKMSAKDNKEMTANTGAFASVGPHAQLASWVTEAVNFHNMDNATEGTRTLNFMVADLSGVFDDDQSVIEGLKEVLNSPPSVLLSSPVKTILPYCLRILARPDPTAYSQDLLGLCEMSDDSTSTPDTPADHRRTMHNMWKRQELNRLRHQLVIGQWCLTALNHRKADFTAAVWEISNGIRSLVQDILLDWTLRRLESRQNPLDDRDRRFIGLLAKGYRDSERDRVTESELKTLEDASGKSDASQDEEKCPACSQPIAEGDIGVAKCVKGHEWARCSVTGFLITDSTYRVCNTCPAISLFPRRHLPVPIGVDADGLDSDWKRFAQPREKSLVEELLESAVLCVMCGGRWVRAM